MKKMAEAILYVPGLTEDKAKKICKQIDKILKVNGLKGYITNVDSQAVWSAELKEQLDKASS